MAIALSRTLIVAFALGVGWILGGCAAVPPAVPRAVSPAVPPVAPKGLDPGYDWRNLSTVQFGSQLQDLHFPVHEVLLFGDRQKETNVADPVGEECYAPEAPARRFVGRDVDSYLLCYVHGRLDRVEAIISLPVASAAGEFSRYCDDWQIGTVFIEPRTAVGCTGTQQHGQSFSASLGESADGVSVPLSIIVSNTPFSNSP